MLGRLWMQRLVASFKFLDELLLDASVSDKI